MFGRAVLAARLLCVLETVSKHFPAGALIGAGPLAFSMAGFLLGAAFLPEVFALCGFVS